MTSQTLTPADREAPVNPAAHAWKTFQEESAEHVLTVLHDDGLYRHLRMAAPGTRMWSWDIVTWPDHLATSGDIADGFTFSREPDMIGFFGQPKGLRPYYSDGAPSIDFRYWAEKLQGDQRETAKEYEHDSFVRYVTDCLNEQLEDDDDLTQSQVDSLIEDAKSVDEDEAAAYEWLSQNPDHFSDPYENDFREFTLTFQLACYAVNATAQAYLQHKNAAEAEAAVTEKPESVMDLLDDPEAVKRLEAGEDMVSIALSRENTDETQ